MSAAQAAAALRAGIEEAGLPVDPEATLPPGASVLELLAVAEKEPRLKWENSKQGKSIVDLIDAGNWHQVARVAQLPPPGDWHSWLIMAGRGFGKTRAGAEWVMEQVSSGKKMRIALVAQTLDEARKVLVEGESGILSIANATWMPDWQPANRRLVWKDAVATLYSASEPEALRGPQHHFAWCDEIAKWPRGPEVWQHLQMGLRLGQSPQVVATTTPRPVPLIRHLLAQEGAGLVRTGGPSTENRSNLANLFFTKMTADYGGTTVGRQELGGELIEEIEGALWSRPVIEAARVAAMPEGRRRTVVAVDPPAGVGAQCDACGIVVVALGDDGAAYVLDDASVQGASPEGWARAVAEASERWAADRVVAEANNGGAMVQSLLLGADGRLPVKLVHASTGKVARAEPVQALYERGRMFHVGAFPALEDELCGLMVGGGYEGPGRSPDRADALVWAVSELLLGKKARVPAVRLL